MSFQQLIALVDGDLTNFTDVLDIPFVDIKPTSLRDKVDNSGTDGIGYICRHQVFLFHDFGNKHAQLGEFLIYVEFRTIPFDKVDGVRFAPVGAFAFVEIGL